MKSLSTRAASYQASSVALVIPGTMTLGALLGGLLGYACDKFFPAAPLGSYSILGSAAVLAAATQGPVSTVVLILELTWQVEPLMAPLLVVVIGATAIAHRLESRSIYASKLIEVQFQASDLSDTPWAELAVSHLHVVSATARYAEVARRLLTFDSRGIPLYVVDEQGTLVGEIWAANVAQTVNLPVPRETAIASDLAMPIHALTSSENRPKYSDD